MRIDDIRFLFAYDRWATERVLGVLDGVAGSVWRAPAEVGDRGLGSILVHQLGAAQRWRHSLQQLEGEMPAPEDGPLPSTDELRVAWATEWAAVDAWLADMGDGFLAFVPSEVGADAPPGVPIWQMLAHLANHGTQHRSEAAALLTQAGHSPGELDMIDFAEAWAGGPDGAPGS